MRKSTARNQLSPFIHNWFFGKPVGQSSPMSSTNIRSKQSTLSNGSSNDMKDSYHQQVLASFLTTIPKNKGWWYQLPEMLPEEKIKTNLCTDIYLPYLGAIFGLAEEATAIILIEMGLLKHNNKTGTRVDQGEWENLKALFGLRQELEVQRTCIRIPNGNKLSKWFIKVGSCCNSPSKVWCQKIIPPTKLVTRETSQFVFTKLVDFFERVTSSRHFLKQVFTLVHFYLLPRKVMNKLNNQVIQMIWMIIKMRSATSKQEIFQTQVSFPCWQNLS